MSSTNDLVGTLAPGGTDGMSAVDLSRLRQQIERRLDELVPPPDSAPANLNGAIRHALLAPSKRVRPVMTYLVAAPAPGLHLAALDAGCALEMVHTASLILDDLPCMDDAQLRRQRPTTHRAFGESTAILAAIALLNCAFGTLARLPDTKPATRTRLAAILSDAIGTSGLVAGQELDLSARGKNLDANRLEQINWLKTGVLFVAAAEIGAVLADLEHDQIGAIGRFARHFGLAFQAADDLADQTGAVAELGKDVGKDANKPTLIGVMGLEHTQLSCEQHLALAREALAQSRIEGAGLLQLIERVVAAKRHSA